MSKVFIDFISVLKLCGFFRSNLFSNSEVSKVFMYGNVIERYNLKRHDDDDE